MILIKPKLRSDSDSPNKLFDGADALFKDEVKKYSFMWRDGGQFSTDKYKT